MMLLLVGSALSTATQLRVDSLPFGPGETLVAVGLLVAVLRAIWLHCSGISRAPGDFLIFWLAGMALLALGALTGSLLGSQPGAPAVHDTFAYVFAALFCIALEPVVADRPREGLIGLVQAMSAVMVLSALAAFFYRWLPTVDPWYALIRFRGLSENPNQLAFLCVTYPFLCWQLLADRVVSSPRWIWAASFIGVTIGLMTLSDALVVSWGAGITFVGTVRLVRKVRRLRSPYSALAAVAVAVISGTVLVGSGVAALLGSRLYENLLATYEEGAQGSVRLVLWRHATEAIWQTGMLGAGPGAHSGLNGPFERIEAHNLYLDWAAASGVIGLTLLGSLLVIILVRCIRSRSLFLIGALIGIMLFGFFHHVLRQPLFWSCVIVISYYARARKQDTIDLIALRGCVVPAATSSR